MSPADLFPLSALFPVPSHAPDKAIMGRRDLLLCPEGLCFLTRVPLPYVFVHYGIQKPQTKAAPTFYSFKKNA